MSTSASGSSSAGAATAAGGTRPTSTTTLRRRAGTCRPSAASARAGAPVSRPTPAAGSWPASRRRESAWRAQRGAGAGGGALEQQLALASVARQRRGPLELGARLVEAAELGQELGADARQVVV